MPDTPEAPAIVRSTSLERDPLKANFKNFMWKTWRTLGFPDPTDVHYDMADYLQHGPDKSITMGFRGVAKSYTAVDYSVYSLYCDPDEMVLTLSATGRFAANNAHFAFAMINGFDWLAHMRPKTTQRQSALAFDVRDAKPKKSESFCAESIFGQIVGRRATIINPDDIEIPTTSDTEGARMELRRAYGELGGAILLPGGKIKVLGTPQNEHSIYTELATEKGYGMRIWPIIYPSPKERIEYGTWLAPMIDRHLAANPNLEGTSTEPTRFSEADIAERALEFGKTEFARQFRLFTSAGKGNDTPLKLRDLMVMDWAAPLPGQPLKLPPEVRWGPSDVLKIPEDILKVDAITGDHCYYPSYVSPQDQWRPCERVVAYVDPSGGGMDETTWGIAAQLNGLAFTCALGSDLRGYSNEVLDLIAADCKLWGVNYIYVESNLGQGMFGTLLAPALAKVGCKAVIEEDRKGVQSKEARIIASLEPPVTAHRVVVNLKLLQKDYDVTYDNVEAAKRRFYRLTYQFTRMTKARGAVAHDDRVDGLGSLIGKLVDFFRQQTDEARKQDREAAANEEIERLIQTRIDQGLPTFGATLGQGSNGLGRAQARDKSKFFRGR